MNKTTFFSYIRKAPFGGRLTQQQVEGIDAILAAMALYAVTDLRWMAYILATAFHETGGRMQPVREGFAKTDAQARKVVAARAYGKAVDGHVYYGRGHVQLTWKENYLKMGKALGIDLAGKPDLALDAEISARILVMGMVRGLFSGKKLADYFGMESDPAGARKIINGTDKAKLIAGYHQNFLDALEAAQGHETPLDACDRSAAPDKPNLLTDQATLGTVSAVAGSGIFGAFTAIDSPWAFAAFAVVALGVYLFATGRIKIIRKGGV